MKKSTIQRLTVRKRFPEVKKVLELESESDIGSTLLSTPRGPPYVLILMRYCGTFFFLLGNKSVENTINKKQDEI